MRSLFGALYNRVRIRAGVPSNAEIRRWCSDRELKNLNDHEVWNNDPHKENLAAAFELRKLDQENGLRDILLISGDGSAWAMFHAGMAYKNGRGTPVNLPEAEHWLRLSFEAGCERALLYLGDLLIARGALDEAEAAFRSGAAKGWASSLYRLARFRSGRHRSRIDRLEEKRLLIRAATSGHPGASLQLAKNMSRGRYGLIAVIPGLMYMLEIFSWLLPEMEKLAKGS